MPESVKVLVTARLPDELLLQLREHFEVEAHDREEPMERSQFLEALRDKSGLLCTIRDRVDSELLGNAPRLAMISNFGVGYDHIDMEAASQRRILVSNTPGVLTEATAELTLALMLALARRVVEGDQITRQGAFRFWSPFHFLGTEVSGKTLGIVGLGRIGRAVAIRAKAFSMKILYHSRRRLEPQEEAGLGITYLALRDLLKRADIITLHVPLTPETHHLIGEAELSCMKPSALLINTSRGPVVDEKALVQALRERRLGGAGLDVYEHEPLLAPGLTKLSNTVLLPHIGSATLETRTRMGQMAVGNLISGLLGRRPPHVLNWERVMGTSRSE